MTLPKAGGPAQVQWFFNHDPAAGIGNETRPDCSVPVHHGHTGDDTIGAATVPRSVFESSGPQTFGIEIRFDVPGDQGGMVHATERYEFTIQRA